MIKMIRSLNKYNLIHSWLWIGDRPINQKETDISFSRPSHVLFYVGVTFLSNVFSILWKGGSDLV